MINKQKKESVILEMTDIWKNAKSIVFYSFDKMAAADMEYFRKEIRRNNLRAYVCKNSLMGKSAEKVGIEINSLAEKLFIGQTGVVYSEHDPLVGPKTMDQIIKEKRKPIIKGGFFEGKFITPENVKALASIPSREILNQQLAYTLLAPVTMLACTLNNTVAKIAYALNAVKEQKEKQI
jgi:large subunit ribosomal protein L10